MYGRFLEPGVFLQRFTGKTGALISFEGCVSQGNSLGLCHLVIQDEQQNVSLEHTGFYGSSLDGQPNGFGVYRDKTR